MTKPAARIGDNHACRLSGHIGGPIVTGAQTVIIEGKPVARVSDKARCHGPDDTISTGSNTVIIEGQPAARIGDRTVHHGVITQGAATVLIGD